MGIFGDSAGPRLIEQSWPGCRRAWTLPRGVVVFAALQLVCILSGCAGNDSAALLIDPGRYELFKCDDLAARWKLVSARERELRALMDRASQSGGGAVVGSLAYRTDYETVLSDERLLQRTAAAKNCPQSYQVPGQVSGQIPGQIPGAVPQPVPMQSGPPPAGQAPGGSTKNTVYQSDQGIR
jgi:hypothetical protein